MKRAAALLIALFTLSCAALPWQTAPIVPEKVSEGVYRGPHPDFGELAKVSIGAIISLEDDPAEIERERSGCLAMGMPFVSIPLSEYTAPTPEVLRKIVEQIQLWRQENVYVHCRRGIDRTGYAIAAYRIIVEDWSFDRAYAEVLAHGHSEFFYGVWKRSLEDLQ